MTTWEQIHAVILEHLGECSIEELRVICTLLARLEAGRSRYGTLDLTSDRRDWEAEADEELADAVMYLAIRRLVRRESP